MKNRYILLQVVPPIETDDHDKFQRWKEARNDAINKNKQTEGTLLLGDNCWLLPKDSKLHLLAALISAARSRGLEYSIRYLCDEDDETTS